MARLSIGRTIVTTICEVKYFDENNDLQNATVELLGDYNIETAQRAAIKKLKARGGIVKSIKHKSFYGVMSIEEFAQRCKKSRTKEW